MKIFNVHLNNWVCLLGPKEKKNLFLTGATKAVINSCIDNHTEGVKDFFFRRGYNDFIKVLLHM